MSDTPNAKKKQLVMNNAKKCKKVEKKLWKNAVGKKKKKKKPWIN